MAERNPPGWLQAGSHPSENDRLFIQSLLGGSPNQVIPSGILASADFLTVQHGTPNMSVDVAKGSAIIDGTESVNQGVYHVYNDATVNLAVTTADPVNPRWDLLVFKVQDAAYSGAVNSSSLAIVAGTPAGSPALPATPNNAIALYKIVVPAAAASIVNANLTDLRVVRRPVMALGYESAGGPLPANVLTSISAQAFAINVGGWTLSSGALVVPMAGVYRVSAQITMSAITSLGILQVALTRNGATSVTGNSTYSPAGLNVVTTAGPYPITCAVGDTLGMSAIQTTSGSQGVPAGAGTTFIYAERISA